MQFHPPRVNRWNTCILCVGTLLVSLAGCGAPETPAARLSTALPTPAVTQAAPRTIPSVTPDAPPTSISRASATAAGALVATNTPSEVLSEQAQQGMDKAAQGDYTGAIALYNQALAI